MMIESITKKSIYKKMKQKFVVTALTVICLSFISCSGTKKEEDKKPETIAANWAGTYKGTLPCADCEGIETSIVFKADNTFEKTETYLKGEQKDTFTESGTLTWNETKTHVTLVSGSGFFQYKVSDNSLTALDSEGEEVSGDLASHYVLKKK